MIYRNKKDYIYKNEKFNRLTALENARIANCRILFLCDCGKIKEIYAYSVKHNKTKSCGCFRKEAHDKKSIMIKSHLNHNYFKKWSNNMAYILGFTTADGCVCSSRPRLTYNLARKDIEILEFIKKEISPLSTIGYYQSKCQNKYYDSIALQITSNELIKDLKKLYIVPQKTGKEILPNIPEKFQRDYLRGLFDGDGCICKSKQFKQKQQKYYNTYIFSICCASQQFLKDIRFMFDSIGGIVRIKNIYDWRVTGYSNIKGVYHILYDDANFSLNRKFLKFKKILSYA